MMQIYHFEWYPFTMLRGGGRKLEIRVFFLYLLGYSHALSRFLQPCTAVPGHRKRIPFERTCLASQERVFIATDWNRNGAPSSWEQFVDYAAENKGDAWFVDARTDQLADNIAVWSYEPWRKGMTQELTCFP